MTTRRRYKPYDWEPLNMTRAEVAEIVFRRSEAWFLAHTPEDFPQPVDGLYNTEAVKEWNRARHGLAPTQDDDGAAEREMLRDALRGKVQGAVSRRKAA
jgi:hypothetical protein